MPRPYPALVCLVSSRSNLLDPPPSQKISNWSFFLLFLAEVESRGSDFPIVRGLLVVGVVLRLSLLVPVAVEVDVQVASDVVRAAAALLPARLPPLSTAPFLDAGDAANTPIAELPPKAPPPAFR